MLRWHGGVLLLPPEKHLRVQRKLAHTACARSCGKVFEQLLHATVLLACQGVPVKQAAR
jgi:hypothetical protein